MGKKSKSVTVGYKYYLGLHFGICHGPVDSVERIEVSDRTAWTGNQTSSGQIYIDSPALFGGENKEGGVQGSTDVMMGESSQGINDYLQSKQGGVQPAYRGILGLVFRGGLISVNNPYVKPWAVRVRRVVAGWHNNSPWYSSKASISLNGVICANPAHIIYECLTNPVWGMGYPTSIIDNASFVDAADAFYSEGFGLCIAWGQQDTINNFIQVVLDHAGAILSQDAGGGQFKLKALRADYSPSALPVFSDSNGSIVSLEKIERSTYTENVNEIIVQFVDASTGRNSSIYVQNLANVQAQGSVVSSTRQYLGLPNASLATRVGMRDLKASTSGLARITFVANRSAYALVPGDVIKFTWAPAGITTMFLRITRIDYGPLQSGMIRIEGIEDVFGLPSTTYAGIPPINWTPPNYTPYPAADYLIQEATYRDLYDQLGNDDIGNVDALSGYIVAAASRPINGISFNYGFETRAGSAAYTSRPNGDWAPYGKLSGNISKATQTLSLSNATDLDSIGLNTLAFLGTGANSEIVQILSVNFEGPSLTVKRGCVDTVPSAWPMNTPVIVYELHSAQDEIEYVSGETISARFITNTATGVLASGIPVATVTLSQRQYRPYPPALVRFNNQQWPVEVFASMTITWAHRDRLIQADNILGQDDATLASPEPGTTYRVLGTRTSNNSVVFDQTISGTSFVYTPLVQETLNVSIRSLRDGLESYQRQTHTIIVSPLNATANVTTASAGFVASGTVTDIP